MQQQVVVGQRRLVFLDGIRGWAALAVVFYHLLPTFVLTVSEQHSIRWLMPLMDGTLAVYVFFVISGFSLSIAFVRSGSKRGIASLAVRRYPRLAIPILAASILGFAMMRLGLNAAPQLAALTGRTNWPVAAYQFHETFGDAIRFALWDVFFHYELMHSYNPVLWTMSIELAGSAIIFAALTVLGRSPVRWFAYGALWVGCVAMDSPFSAFIAGIVLAEIYDSGTLQRLRSSPYSVPISTVLIAITWYISTVQRHLYSATTTISILGTILVASVLVNNRFIGAMETRLSHKLGLLSFPLYLTHVVIVCIVGSRLGIWLIGFGINGFALAALELLVVVPLCIGGALLFYPVELLAVETGRRLARVCGLSSSANLPGKPES
jgi:peptidoglycan/LPS O-acetylase OafA/YrhL